MSLLSGQCSSINAYLIGRLITGLISVALVRKIRLVIIIRLFSCNVNAHLPWVIYRIPQAQIKYRLRRKDLLTHKGSET